MESAGVAGASNGMITFRRVCYGVCGVLVGEFLIRPVVQELWRGIQSVPRTVLRSLLHRQPLVNASLLKGLLFDIALPPLGGYPDHTHPDCAAARNQAVRWIEGMVQRIGRRAVFLQARAPDERAGRSYTCEWRWVSDMSVNQRVTRISPTDVLVLVDVDYYVDMPKLLSDYSDNLVIMYTVTPDSAGKTTDEYAYCFDEHGRIKMHVSGGAEFKHALWDYSVDEMRTCRSWWSSTSYRLVERRYMDVDHSVVALVPAGRSRFGTDWLAGLFGLRIDAAWLKTFNPVVQGYARFMVNQKGKAKITTAKVDSYHSCVVDADVDSMVRVAASATTVTLTNHTVASYGITKEQSIFLVDYWRNACPQVPPVMALGTAPVFHYETGPVFDEEAKCSVVPFMAPLVAGGAFAPLVSEGNMACAIIKRVNEIGDKTRISSGQASFVDRCMNEFIELVLNEAGVLPHSIVPSDFEQLYETQCSRNQRIMLENSAVTADVVEDASAFMKREPYPEIKEPRVITNYKAGDKSSYGLYIYALSDVVKRCHWYSFVTPSLLEERMLRALGGARRRGATDFSRMDGRYGKLLRQLEVRFALRCLVIAEHDGFLKCHREDHHKRVFAAFELFYWIIWHRGSGSPATSMYNTFANAFCQYMGFRVQFAPMDPSKGASQPQYSPTEAYALVGMAGGDDGALALPEDYDVGRMVYACSLVGQKLELDEIPPELPLPFLGRYYGELTAHSANSCADIRRQLVKFHLTTDKLASPLTKFVEKAYAFYVLDPETPVLGMLGAKAERLRGKHSVSFSKDGTVSYNAMLALMSEGRFTNKLAEWMVDLFDRDLPGFEVGRFVDWCAQDGLVVERPFLTLETSVVSIDATVHEPKITEEEVRELQEKPKRPGKEDAVERKETPDKPDKGEPAKRKDKPRVCHNCGKPGHLKKDCKGKQKRPKRSKGDKR